MRPCTVSGRERERERERERTKERVRETKWVTKVPRKVNTLGYVSKVGIVYANSW